MAYFAKSLENIPQVFDPHSTQRHLFWVESCATITPKASRAFRRNRSVEFARQQQVPAVAERGGKAFGAFPPRSGPIGKKGRNVAKNLVTGKGTSWEIKPGVYQYRFNLGKDPMSGMVFESGDPDIPESACALDKGGDFAKPKVTYGSATAEQKAAVRRWKVPTKYLYSPKRTLHCESKSKRGREAELADAMAAYKVELNTGLAPTRTTPQTVGEYAEQFHALREGTMRSQLSYSRERYDIDHIKVLFGDVKLTALKPPVIKAGYARARKEGLFSENELNKLHTKLGQIMKEAVNDELITSNPCAKISVPRPQPKEREALTAEEAHRLLECLQEGQMDARKVGALLMLDTGMRRGEMLGLTWEHVDLDAGSVYICQQYANDKVLREPKSKMSRRHLHLSDGMTAVLAAWKTAQAEYLLQIAERPIGRTPVVNNELGQHMDPNNFNRWFRDWCCDHGFGQRVGEEQTFVDTTGRKRARKRGYRGLTPHMLRHTQATLLIGANTDIKTVQARLGHSSVNLTLDTYSHAIAAKDKDAADTFSSLIRG